MEENSCWREPRKGLFCPSHIYWSSAALSWWAAAKSSHQASLEQLEPGCGGELNLWDLDLPGWYGCRSWISVVSYFGRLASTLAGDVFNGRNYMKIHLSRRWLSKSASPDTGRSSPNSFPLFLSLSTPVYRGKRVVVLYKPVSGAAPHKCLNRF